MTSDMQPTLTERAAGLGWIASTPPDHQLPIAAFGPTSEAAVQHLTEIIERWETLPDE